MPAKKKIWLIIGGLAGLAIIAIYFSLPGITTKFLVSQAEKFGLKNLQFKVIHVGWRRLDLIDVTAGDATAPALRIPHLTMEYSLAGLWQKRIKNVRLSGVWIKIEDRGQGFQFPGHDQSTASGGAKRRDARDRTLHPGRQQLATRLGGTVIGNSHQRHPAQRRGTDIFFPPCCSRWRRQYACKARSIKISRPLKWPSRFPASLCQRCRPGRFRVCRPGEWQDRRPR